MGWVNPSRALKLFLLVAIRKKWAKTEKDQLGKTVKTWKR